MQCVVCCQPAVVWCHNDEAALCLSCDPLVHSVNQLAQKHKRTYLDSGELYVPRTSQGQEAAAVPDNVPNERVAVTSHVLAVRFLLPVAGLLAPA